MKMGMDYSQFEDCMYEGGDKEKCLMGMRMEMAYSLPIQPIVILTRLNLNSQAELNPKYLAGLVFPSPIKCMLTKYSSLSPHRIKCMSTRYLSERSKLKGLEE